MIVKYPFLCFTIKNLVIMIMKDKAIWIDKEKAHILTAKGEEVEMMTINSELKDSDEDALDRQGGATEVLKDRKVLEREKQKTKLFFDEVTKELKDAKRIVIIGPAQMGQHYLKYLSQTHVEIGKHVVKEIKAHKMTDNQLKAMVREFYLSSS